ncbi:MULTISPECIES: glycosyltransferase [unclassified Nocardia]|uniref:glycosyltransferase n=1 Tax=unclassified Nocardia TaxID=2637762 RepID=UPI001CE4AC51|nr:MULTISPECIES: glycosyltransferase family 2 protein [unclassified Nocardia]
MPVAVSQVGIVIVTHNNEVDLTRCLDAIQSNALGAQVVVRDCASTDHSVEVAKRHPVVSTVIAGPNVGFGAGCNDAVRSFELPPKMILILNPDTAIDFALADLLLHVEQYDNFGCASVMQMSFDHRLVWSWDNFPSPRLEWQKARDLPLLQRSPAGYSRDRTVDWVMGALLLIPYDAFIAMDGFDEHFFMFNEEVDLCHRLNDAGLSTHYINRFRYLHDRSNKDTLWREVLRINSRRKYDRKWLSRSAMLSCQLAQSYRWSKQLFKPIKPSDRRLAVPRLLATWGLIQSLVPAPADSATRDTWASVQFLGFTPASDDRCRI